jgi:hypothetical protein
VADERSPVATVQSPVSLESAGDVASADLGHRHALVEHLKQKAFINQLFARTRCQRFPACKVLDPTPQLCDDTGLCRAEQDGHSLYTDDNHLSEIGARLVLPALAPLFDDLALRAPEQANTAR